MDEWIAGFARPGWHDQFTVVVHVAYAMLLGGAIGVERELKDRPAGFRTHMLVAGAASLLVGLGDILSDHYIARPGHDIVRLDAMRLISAVVSAVGFIGAGAIFRRGGAQVGGITTAASLLMVATIGLAAGVHANLLALAATVLTLAVLVMLGWFERRTIERRKRPA